MTRVIGLLSFWDESPTWLAATLASMARVCDHAVWYSMAGTRCTPISGYRADREHYAVIDAARASGMGNHAAHSATHLHR